MDAEDAMAIISENLTLKEAFKVWRLLTSRVRLLPTDVLQDMKEKEPELFAPEWVDGRGDIRFPWQTERH